MKYRAEIDGLRALAVIPVILFHAGFGLFSGGFIGVDVFFVISGYLITTILIHDIENKCFSILGFYERRARRILPALFFVMMVCIPIAWMWMIPSQMENFSQSLVAVSLFASNILFWLTSGYFASAAAEKPLLHTWSLGVEEQYYVIFPIFLIFAWRFGKNKSFWMITILAALSFTLSEFGWRRDSSANFYLAPSRAWELLAGSITAFLIQKRGVQSNNVISFLGLLAIVVAIFVYDESTPFPSAYAIVPVLGVMFIILYADKETLVAKLLGSKIFVGVGLVSYSAYLWHHPLFAFRKIITINEETSISLILCAFSFCLAFFSWKYVERPFRDKSLVNGTWILSLSIIFSLFFIIFGLVGHYNKGFQQRSWVSSLDISERLLPDEFEKNKKCLEYYGIQNPVRFCRKSERFVPHIAIIGDSEGAALYEGLARRLSESDLGLTMMGGRLFTNIATHPIGSAREKKFSEGGAMATKTIAANEEITTVIVVSRGPFYLHGDWEFYLKDDPFEKNREIIMEKGLRAVLNLLQHKNNVIFMLDPPKLGINPESCYKRPLIEANPCTKSKQEYIALHKSYRKIVSQILTDFPDVHVFDPAEVLCDRSFCYGVMNGKVLYGDPGHLNVAGANLISETLVPILLEKISDEVTD